MGGRARAACHCFLEYLVVLVRILQVILVELALPPLWISRRKPGCLKSGDILLRVASPRHPGRIAIEPLHFGCDSTSGDAAVQPHGHRLTVFVLSCIVIPDLVLVTKLLLLCAHTTTAILKVEPPLCRFMILGTAVPEVREEPKNTGVLLVTLQVSTCDHPAATTCCLVP